MSDHDLDRDTESANMRLLRRLAAVQSHGDIDAALATMVAEDDRIAALRTERDAARRKRHQRRNHLLELLSRLAERRSRGMRHGTACRCRTGPDGRRIADIQCFEPNERAAILAIIEAKRAAKAAIAAREATA